MKIVVGLRVDPPPSPVEARLLRETRPRTPEEAERALRAIEDAERREARAAGARYPPRLVGGEPHEPDYAPAAGWGEDETF